VIAADREVVANGGWICAAFDLSDAPKEDVGGISVLLVARYDAALTPNALRHVEMKAVLLAILRRTLRDSWSGRHWLDFVQGRLRPMRRRVAQHESDAIISGPLDEW
jgi:hypothetical protein